MIPTTQEIHIIILQTHYVLLTSVLSALDCVYSRVINTIITQYYYGI